MTDQNASKNNVPEWDEFVSRDDAREEMDAARAYVDDAMAVVVFEYQNGNDDSRAKANFVFEKAKAEFAAVCEKGRRFADDDYSRYNKGVA